MTARNSEAGAATRAVAPAGIRFRKSMREIAVDLYGAERAAASWHGDSRMRAKVRRLAGLAPAAPDEGPDDAGHGTP